MNFAQGALAMTTTYIALAHPRPGVWTLTPAAGSAAISSVEQAKPAPQPTLTARVHLAGCSEQLTYRYRPVTGTRTSLYAVNGAQRTYLGLVHSGTGVLRFTPALTGVGQIDELVTRGVYPSPERVITTFSPAARSPSL